MREPVWAGAGELAVPMKSLHTIPVADTLNLPRWDPFTAASLRVAAADPMMDAESLDRLRAQWSRAQRDYHALTMPRTGMIHGDAHPGNLLRTPADTTVLTDLDSTGTGPIAWDLAIVTVDGIRFGHRTFYHDFAAAYGTDVTSWTELNSPTPCGDPTRDRGLRYRRRRSPSPPDPDGPIRR